MAKKILINKDEFSYEYKKTQTGIEVTLKDKIYKFAAHDLADIARFGSHFVLDNRDFFIEKAGGRKSKRALEGDSLSPMPGKILKVLVKVGDKVIKGDPLIIMEAMKMEHTLKAGKDGVVKAVKFSEGDLVQGQVELVELEL